MTTLREAAQMALEAMLSFSDDISDDMFESIKALRAALATEQEPVAQVQVAEDYYPHVVFLDGVDTTALDQKFLYIAPQQQPEPPCKTGSQCVGGKCERCAEQEWQGLTDAVVQTLIETAIEGYASNRDSMRWLCRAIEAKLREKNS